MHLDISEGGQLPAAMEERLFRAVGRLAMIDKSALSALKEGMDDVIVGVVAFVASRLRVLRMRAVPAPSSVVWRDLPKVMRRVYRKVAARSSERKFVPQPQVSLHVWRGSEGAGH